MTTAVVALSLYAVIVAGLLVANHRLVNATRRIDGEYPHNVPVRNPITQADIDAMWLSVWPTGDDDEVSLRFEQIVSAEWHWDPKRDAA